MNNTACKHQQVFWSDAETVLRDIRMRVFMDEQQVSAADEWDGQDETAIHFLTYLDNDQPIATARVLVEADEAGESLYHIGRVAVLEDYRQQGIGRSLMAYVIGWCIQQSSTARLYLHAQTSRTAFYKYLGFVPQGTEFMDAGIPHITMWYRPAQ
jgi:predicted GNAT family N-acyltransferase